MSLLGIDVGTTGAKAIVLSEEGKLLASVRREYNIVRPQPGWAELDSSAIWRQLEDMIREAAAETAADPVVALSYFRQGLEQMATAGIAIKELRATGGGARSNSWLQVSADILDLPLLRPRVTEASALGATILAGSGSGVYASIQQAVSTLVRGDRTFNPDPCTQAAYAESFARYQLLYPLCQSVRPG